MGYKFFFCRYNPLANHFASFDKIYILLCPELRSAPSARLRPIEAKENMG